MTMTNEDKILAEETGVNFISGWCGSCMWHPKQLLSFSSGGNHYGAFITQNVGCGLNHPGAS